MNGDELKALRQAVGISRQTLADDIPISVSLLKMMERGERAISGYEPLLLAHLQSHARMNMERLQSLDRRLQVIKIKRSI